jgi:predicted NUDIX family phosphoesterase
MAKKEDEMILVMKREDLPPVENGRIIPNPGGLERLVLQNGFFMRRGSASTNPDSHPLGNAETDPAVKQIVPYAIFEYVTPPSMDPHYFLMQRATNGDARLSAQYSLGIGGHLRETDLKEQGLFGFAKRELEEEVSYEGNLTPDVLGIINDDTTHVNQFHFGFVIRLSDDSPNIRIRRAEEMEDGIEEHQQGYLASVEQIRSVGPQLESWSQIVLNHLVSNPLSTRVRTTDSGIHIAGALPSAQ